MSSTRRTIEVVDPRGHDALYLLRQAAIEARAMYPELHAADAPWPQNVDTVPGGTYLIAYDSGAPVACGALRPIDAGAVEVRRMYVLQSHRRGGFARRVLMALEASAVEMGYAVMRLETGDRQRPALALYESFGFVRIPPFGDHVNDPTSVCFEKRLVHQAAR